MSAATFAERCTQPQRDFIRTLLHRAELSTERFSYSHRPVFKAARLELADPCFDESVDLYLRNLDKAEASRLIDTLKQHVGQVDDMYEDDEDAQLDGPHDWRTKAALERHHRNRRS